MFALFGRNVLAYCGQNVVKAINITVFVGDGYLNNQSVVTTTMSFIKRDTFLRFLSHSLWVLGLVFIVTMIIYLRVLICIPFITVFWYEGFSRKSITKCAVIFAIGRRCSYRSSLLSSLGIRSSFWARTGFLEWLVGRPAIVPEF